MVTSITVCGCYTDKMAIRFSVNKIFEQTSVQMVGSRMNSHPLLSFPTSRNTSKGNLYLFKMLVVA
jgi:hypothetical protein